MAAYRSEWNRAVRSLESLKQLAAGTGTEALANEALRAARRALDAAVDENGSAALASGEASDGSSCLRAIAEGTAAKIGGDFFDSLARCLSESLQTACALVGQRVKPDNTRARILSIWECGRFGEPFEYEIAGTPCEVVFETGDAYFRSGVAERFPEDAWLTEHHMDSYIGIGLRDANDRIIGNLCVLDTKPLETSSEMDAILKIFAARASAELQRQQMTDELEAANRELTQALADLQHARDAEIRTERLRSMGELASGVAHNFNNLLAVILAHSESLLFAESEHQDAAEIRDHVQQIHQAGIDAATVVRRLGDLYRPVGQAINETINLGELIESVVLQTRPRWRDQPANAGIGIDVVTNLEQNTFVRGNDSDLRQALTNLLFNAVDALPEGGRIDVRLTQHGDYARVEVCDNGLGMDEETLKGCLKPYFSTKPETGTGLGLSTTLSVVERHGGALTVMSALGNGATFKFDLPLTAPGDEVSGKEVMGTGTAVLRILLVDDDPLVLQSMSLLLAQMGHDVRTAESGADALRAFDAAQVDIIVTDRAMPGMSGDQFAEAVQSLSPRVPVIMLTGFGAVRDASDELPPGVDLILPKPTPMDKLSAALCKLGGARG